jgi:tRNA (cytidine/uridine-2'-O-)-methyltransferase
MGEPGEVPVNLLDVLFDVVLHEPEIPNNTGNIGRTCMATGCRLHLIHPLGFETSEKACRRAGLDYWPRFLAEGRVCDHTHWEAFLSTRTSSRLWYFTTKARRSYFEADLRPGDALVFGKETAGLPESLLAAHPEQCLVMPMLPQERSLNLATAVCAVVYEGLRQAISRGEVGLDAAQRIVRTSTSQRS